VLAVLRRRERSPIAIGATVALSYTVFYALVETWTFQYLAWGMALWLLLPWRAALVCHVVGGGFVYAVYAYVCGDPFLLATWDFAGHETWPVWLVVWRDAANLTFLGVGGWALVQAARTWRRRRRGRANAGPAPAADHLAS
jgi:hypothetical protein